MTTPSMYSDSDDDYYSYGYDDSDSDDYSDDAVIFFDALLRATVDTGLITLFDIEDIYQDDLIADYYDDTDAFSPGLVITDFMEIAAPLMKVVAAWWYIWQLLIVLATANRRKLFVVFVVELMSPDV